MITRPDHHTRMAYALESLSGLSVGDAVGEALNYNYYEARASADFTVFRDGSVRYTDDTEMAIGIVETLGLLRAIDSDALAWKFSIRYQKDPDRGYGRMARKLLREIAAGESWQEVSSRAFGQGSFGNGAAMRVAPVGAYFYDDLDAAIENAKHSAVVTHYHPEGVAGAIAVAVAAAVTKSSGLLNLSLAETRSAIWTAILELTPESEVRRRLKLASESPEASSKDIAQQLGNGAEICAQDTVPFCIWSACNQLDQYFDAIVDTIEVGGDCDTNCAIVGGIVSLFTGVDGIPKDWLRVREVISEFPD